MAAAKKKTKKVTKKPVKRVVRKPAKKVPAKLRAKRKAKAKSVIARHEGNPIIEPSYDNHWEAKATFNPTALHADGKVHIIYRAIGTDDVSRLGYARSDDGLSIDERLTQPCYTIGHAVPTASLDYQIPYCSGGGWNGGCEDPRLTLIGDRVYIIYTAFDGWGSVRMALSSISLDDFLARRWNWRKPVIISPPGEIHKNWVLFPEKINGKFAILHSLTPEVRVDYFDSLDELDGVTKFIRSSHVGRRADAGGAWDSFVRGVGPAPIKTKYGWLVLYHGMDDRDPNRYKLGAMILDKDDPTKVLYRAKKAILAPDECYENEGYKSGVIYSCGAVVMGEELFVYYGGADKVTCVATVHLDSFLKELVANGAVSLKRRATLRR